MTLIRIASELQTPPVDWGGTTAELRIYASTPFYSSENVFVQAGRVGTDEWCQSVPCTIDGDGFVTIDAFELYSTSDSSVPNATYTAVFFDSAGRQRATKLSQFFVDPNGLQVQGESGVTVTQAGVTNTLVSGAGSLFDNGLYTLRGTNNSHPFYNLQGQPTDTVLACVNNNGGGFWLITSSSGVTDYSFGGNKPLPYSSPATYGVVGGVSPAPTVTSSADSTASAAYSQRGTSIGRNFYVIEGYDDSTNAACISWDGTQWVVYSVAGAILYTNADDVSFPWEATTAWTVVNGTNSSPVVAENTAVVSTTWEAVTISQQGLTMNFFNSPPTWAVPQIKEYVALIVGEGGDTPFAAAGIPGKTALDVNPAIPTSPIAIGTNSPIISTLQTNVSTLQSQINLKAPIANPHFTGGGVVVDGDITAGNDIIASGDMVAANLSGTNTGDQTIFNGGSPSAVVDTIQFRRGTAAAWTSANPTLASGEEGLETDTRKTKIGDGTTNWVGLAYTTGTITLTGDVTGSGTSSIAATIANGVVTNAMLAGSIDQSKLVGSIPASKLVESDIVLTESQVTNLTSDLALKANLISPSFTTPALGTITAGVLTAGTVATQSPGDSSTKIASTAFVQGLGVGAIRYNATLSQSGTSAPTAQVLVNNTGIAFTWARSSTGIYTMTAGSGTPFSSPQKVQIYMGNDYLKVDPTHDTVIRAIKTSSTVITVEVTEVGVSLMDGLLSNTSISVTVYP